MTRLIGVIKSLFDENEFSNNELSDKEVVVRFESNYSILSTTFHVEDEDEYEHSTEIVSRIPSHKRGEIAEAAISEPFIDINPVMPPDSDKLLLYGNTRGLSDKDETEIRDNVLNDIGRIAGFDNEKRPVFNHILSKK